MFFLFFSYNKSFCQRYLLKTQIIWLNTRLGDPRKSITFPNLLLQLWKSIGGDVTSEHFISAVYFPSYVPIDFGTILLGVFHVKLAFRVLRSVFFCILCLLGKIVFIFYRIIFLLVYRINIGLVQDNHVVTRKVSFSEVIYLDNSLLISIVSRV